MAVIARQVDAGFRPIDERVEESALDPYINEVAVEIGLHAAEATTAKDAEAVVAAAEVNFLHGVLFGLELAHNEAGVKALVRAMGAEQHYDDVVEAINAGLEFNIFEKVGGTSLARVSGPFSCTTIDGNVAHCANGWLGVDAEGHLYPVADSVARQTYALPAPPF